MGRETRRPSLARLTQRMKGSTSFGLIRQNTKVALGEYVEVKKAE